MGLEVWWQEINIRISPFPKRANQRIKRSRWSCRSRMRAPTMSGRALVPNKITTSRIWESALKSHRNSCLLEEAWTLKASRTILRDNSICRGGSDKTKPTSIKRISNLVRSKVKQTTVRSNRIGLAPDFHAARSSKWSGSSRFLVFRSKRLLAPSQSIPTPNMWW